MLTTDPRTVIIFKAHNPISCNHMSSWRHKKPHTLNAHVDCPNKKNQTRVIYFRMHGLQWWYICNNENGYACMHMDAHVCAKGYRRYSKDTFRAARWKVLGVGTLHRKKKQIFIHEPICGGTRSSPCVPLRSLVARLKFRLLASAFNFREIFVVMNRLGLRNFNFEHSVQEGCLQTFSDSRRNFS